MNCERRLQALQEWMSRVRANQQADTFPELSDWLSALGAIREDLALNVAALRNIADINEALRLICQLHDAAHTRQVGAEQVRCLIDLVQVRLEGIIEQLRPVYL